MPPDLFHRLRIAQLRRGFSLVEMLMVLAIIGLVAGLTVPSVQGLLSSNLRGGADSVAALLDIARQSAIARNLPVDVRIYQDPSKPVDHNGNHPYRLLSIVIPASTSGAASDEFLAPPLPLFSDVIIDSNPQFSSALSTSLGATGFQPASSTELATAPSAVRNLFYIKFTYLANGMINLDPTVSGWCLTLVNQSKAYAATNTNVPAANFVVLVFDVQTGRVRLYQP